MSTPPNQRSVKIDADERGGWSSDRPRREGGPARPPDISVRSRALSPADALRYSPGSLVVVTAATSGAGEDLVERVIQNRGAVLSRAKVRDLIKGRVPDEELEDRAEELLEAAARKRLEAGDTVVVTTETLAPEEREPFVRMAAGFSRPRHLILVEPAGADVEDDDKAALAELRRRVGAGDVGGEGFQTALRLAGTSITELKRITFERPPRDD
jgi:hypothetical protein